MYSAACRRPRLPRTWIHLPISHNFSFPLCVWSQSVQHSRHGNGFLLAKRRAATHISQCGVYAAQAARPQTREELGDVQAQEQRSLSHQLPFPSLVQEALRRVTAVWQNTHALLHTIQNNPLLGHSQAHQGGVRACQEICAEMETLEEALAQLL